MTRTALLLVNRKARAGGNGIKAVRDALTAGGINLVESSAHQGQDISSVIRQHRNQVDLIIIGGGDGTLHHAMEGLVDTRLPLGIVPLGTANDFARTLNLPTDPLAACDVIVQGRVEEFDLGQVNGKLFCNAASIGLAVQVTKRLNRDSKSRWGVLAYLFASLQSLWHSRPFRVEIETGGSRYSARTIQVTVGNGRYYGGALTVDESATAQDDVLHLFSLEIDRWWHILPLIPALRNGKLRLASQVRTLCGTSFDVRTPTRPRHLTADGEFVCSTPARFRCLPRALKVVVPRAQDA